MNPNRAGGKSLGRVGHVQRHCLAPSIFATGAAFKFPSHVETQLTPTGRALSSGLAEAGAPSASARLRDPREDSEFRSGGRGDGAEAAVADRRRARATGVSSRTTSARRARRHP